MCQVLATSEVVVQAEVVNLMVLFEAYFLVTQVPYLGSKIEKSQPCDWTLRNCGCQRFFHGKGLGKLLFTGKCGKLFGANEPESDLASVHHFIIYMVSYCDTLYSKEELTAAT